MSAIDISKFLGSAAGPFGKPPSLEAANLIDGKAAAGNKQCKKMVAASKGQSMTQAAIMGKGMQNHAAGAAMYAEEEEEEIQA